MLKFVTSEGQKGRKYMFKIIKLVTAGLIFSMAQSNSALATTCQNEKIVQLKKIDFSPNLKNNIDGDINGDGRTDKLLYNLAEGWITLDFYVETVSWDTCRPNLSLKLVSFEAVSQVRGWDLEASINEKGSIRIRSCYYGGSRGICHGEYNMVLRYIDQNVRIIGYDYKEYGLNYPSLEFSANLLTGRSIITRSPGILQENIDGIQNTKTKSQNIDYGMYMFRTGDVITVPEELNKAITLLYDDLDE